jgi:hypothetical protein
MSPMQIETVEFERVFAMQRFYYPSGTHTRFTFTTLGSDEKEAKVPGLPTIKPGMVVMAALLKPGDWTSVVGLINVTTEEKAIPNHWTFFGCSLLLTAFFFWILHATVRRSLDTITYQNTVFLALVLLIPSAVFMLWGIRTQKAVKMLYRELAIRKGMS